MTTPKGNKIIAKYMGDDIPNGYNMMWEFLMPVVIRITQDRYEDGQNVFLRTFGMKDRETGDYMVRFNRQVLHKHSDLKTALWMACVDYCKTS